MSGTENVLPLAAVDGIMAFMSTTTQSPKTKRRWYQFSLKTLLVVVSLSCFGFAWIGWRMQQARENRERVAASEKEIEKTVAAIENSGGMVFSGNEERRPQTWLEGQFDDPGDADDPVRDDLKVTTVIFLSYAQGGKVTDAELEQLLKGLENLEDLDLYRTNITDAGLEHVKVLKNLRYLNLHWQKKVTDAGLEYLKGLESLQHLDLRGTNVTDEGVNKLQRALPNCRISH